MAHKSNQKWLKEHFSDIYVKKAKQAGYRSRAVYKLLEIHERHHLFKPGMVVVDLGASPGGFCQLLTKLVKSSGRVIAVDLLPFEPLEGVDFIQGDFRESETFDQVLNLLPSPGADWVISDMAPNMSGNESVDIPSSLYLAELAFDFALQTLKPESGLLLKVFQGEGMDDLLLKCKQQFKKVSICKPQASRSRSKEVFILARGNIAKNLENFQT